jgi:ATP-dependent Clp protease ATP-binding subunit ClpA
MPSKKPVVFVFAGPSGHGKTEISQNLGSLLSLDFHSVDCTSIKNEVRAALEHLGICRMSSA